MGKRYIGVRGKDGSAQVFVEEGGLRRPLPVVAFHGHEIDWAEGGPNGATLSLSIMSDALGEALQASSPEQVTKSRSEALEHAFTNKVVGNLPGDWTGSGDRDHSWSLTEEDVVAWAAAQEDRNRQRAGGDSS